MFCIQIKREAQVQTKLVDNQNAEMLRRRQHAVIPIHRSPLGFLLFHLPVVPRHGVEDIFLCRHNRVFTLRPTNKNIFIGLVEVTATKSVSLPENSRV